MVWGLFPSDSLRGAHKYYIFSKGTYRVGRKDCDITVQTDVAVSRLHAQIVVDEMPARKPDESWPAGHATPVRIVDLSKFGTWINKEEGAKAVRLREKETVVLEDGASVTFGTGSATFRFCYVPLVFHIHGSRSSRVNSSLVTTISSIGGCATYNWSPECTHVLVDESSSVTVDLIEAVVAKKAIIHSDWLKVLVEKNICSEFPSCMSYAPTLNLEQISVKIVESKAREKCLVGYIFVMGSSDKYTFGDKLQPLLEVVGARFLDVDEFFSSSQILTDGEDAHLVLVIPEESRSEFNHYRQLSSLSRIVDTKLVAAILSGHLDPSNIEPPSIAISSSHSTNETIVANSDVEIDTATSDHIAGSVRPQDAIQYEHEAKDTINSLDDGHVREYEDKGENTNCYSIAQENPKGFSHRVENVCVVKKKDKIDGSVVDVYQNSDIIYSQDLIVRSIGAPTSINSTPKNVVNFKRFRKKEIVSGNSFQNLVPFAKDPYMEGSEISAEYMKEERKRRQMEAIADDLFNSERARKRVVAGTSIQAFLARH